MSVTSIDGLLDSPAVSVVAAVPQLVPELVLALHQPLLRPERHRLHRLRPLGAHVPAGQTVKYAQNLPGQNSAEGTGLAGLSSVL